MAKFSIDLSKYVANAMGNVDDVVRKAALEIFSKIILSSPVDTGRFRANWVTTTDSPNRSTNEGFDKLGEMAIEQATVTLATAKAGQVIYLANNLPYAQRLENGWSKQSRPNAMVALNVMNFQAAVDRAVAETKAAP